jgi:hypothetical protein
MTLDFYTSTSLFEYLRLIQTYQYRIYTFFKCDVGPCLENGVWTFGFGIWELDFGDVWRCLEFEGWALESLGLVLGRRLWGPVVASSRVWEKSTLP